MVTKEVTERLKSIVITMTSNALSYLRKESLDIFNRIHSIEEDISFVRQVNQAYPGVPIIRAQSISTQKKPLY